MHGYIVTPGAVTGVRSGSTSQKSSEEHAQDPVTRGQMAVYLATALPY
jgi:hypothetical protein